MSFKGMFYTDNIAWARPSVGKPLAYYVVVKKDFDQNNHPQLNIFDCYPGTTLLRTDGGVIYDLKSEQIMDYNTEMELTTSVFRDDVFDRNLHIVIVTNIESFSDLALTKLMLDSNVVSYGTFGFNHLIQVMADRLRIANVIHILKKEDDRYLYSRYAPVSQVLPTYANRLRNLTLSITPPDFSSLRSLPRVGLYVEVPKIKDVVYNGPATIVFWEDGTKTVVKCGKNDRYDHEKGLMACIVKKVYGNKGNYYNKLREWVRKGVEQDVDAT